MNRPTKMSAAEHNSEEEKVNPELFAELQDILGKIHGDADKYRQISLSSINITFIDQDGEVLQLQTTKNERTSDLFYRYARHQGTPFLLSGIMYHFIYNGELIPLSSTVGDIEIFAGDDPIIIYVGTRLPKRKDLERIINNIPVLVKRNPRCFINQKVINNQDGGDAVGTVRDYLDDTGTFIIVKPDGDTPHYETTDQFIILLQEYYSDFYTRDIAVFLETSILKYKSQVEQLDTQGIDRPNAIITRMIKIRQQIYRLLKSINSAATDQEKWGEGAMDMFDDFSRRLGEVLSSLSDEMKMHISSTSLHKVKKPLLESEEVVWVERWSNGEHYLERGTITSYTEHADIDGYGPRRVYSIRFGNGDLQTDIEDYHVVPEVNYKFKEYWESIGVTRVFDEDSSDQWAREIGWHTVEIDPFIHLSEAIREIVWGYQKQMELGMLQVIDRISDPIMQRIGRLLMRRLDSESDYWGMENSEVFWKRAQGHYNDGNTNRMKDSVLTFAISRQCYGRGFTVCRFFISAEGCLDTFLQKMPIFREGYDSTDSLPGHQSDPEIMMTYLEGNKPEDTDDFMSIKILVGNTTERAVAVSASPFKDFLANYADERETSIKSLRIKHNERTLFISSIGKKTPLDLGIKEDDMLEIAIILSTSNEKPTKEQPKQHNTKKGKNKKKKKHKKSNKKRAQPLVIQKTEVELKVEHSKLLGKVYEEAEPTFKEIRQRLNAMNLERTKPKKRTSPSKSQSAVEVVDNPLADDDQVGGKAGKTQFIIQVGEVSNLYKTTKPSSSVGRGRRQDDIMIDLHGLTTEEAVDRLDKSLPNWIETAMKGTYPFVIPVKIVCGGGSQILAEVVENWIKESDNVANAPKNMYS